MLLLLLPAVAECLTVLHLSDFHLDVNYSTKGDNKKMCREGLKEMDLGSFGDYRCDSPQSLVAFSIREAKRLVPNPDVILWSGDTIPHISDYSQEYVLNALNITTSLLTSAFPSNYSIILPVFGNHDAAPSDTFSVEDSLYNRTWELWKNLVGEDQKETFLLGGYYKKRIGNATVVVLNTNLYYRSNKEFENFQNKDDPAKQFSFLKNELKRAAECRKNPREDCDPMIHILAHIPPGAFEKIPNFYWFRKEFSEEFLKIVVKYAKVIKWMLYGHHHTDTFNLIKDEEGETVQMSLMAPSISPWFGSLQGDNPKNPAFRVYDADDQHNIIDIKTYSVDLSELNQNNSSFTFEYSFREAYSVKGFIDAEFMENLLERMKKNETLFREYLLYNSRSKNYFYPQGHYRTVHFCSLEFSDYEMYEKCTKGIETSASTSFYSALFFVSWLILQ